MINLRPANDNPSLTSAQSMAHRAGMRRLFKQQTIQSGAKYHISYFAF
jgi:hypothetical protein